MKTPHTPFPSGAGRPAPAPDPDLAARPQPSARPLAACGQAASGASPGRRLPLSAWRTGRPRVWLPGPPGRDRRDDGSRSEDVALQGLRVLLVDDSIETLEAFSALLTLEGATVHTATDGLAALHLCDVNGYDLVLSDLGMPRMDGYAFIEALRRRPDARGVIAYALSGFGDCSVERALASGYQAYLAKPVTLDALREAMTRHPPAMPFDALET